MPYSSRARDIMTTRVVTLRPDNSVADAVRLICEHGISGLPVVDDAGRLQGIVSKTDLIACEYERQFDRVCEVDLRAIFGAMGEGGIPETAVGGEESPGESRVGAVMKRAVITASPDTPLTEIALLMQRNNIHRVVIVEGGRLAGIVTSMDLLRLIADKRAGGDTGNG